MQYNSCLENVGKRLVLVKSKRYKKQLLSRQRIGERLALILPLEMVGSVHLKTTFSVLNSAYHLECLLQQ